MSFHISKDDTVIRNRDISANYVSVMLLPHRLFGCDAVCPSSEEH